MINNLKEKFKLYFLSPLRLYFFRQRQAGKYGKDNSWVLWLLCAVVLIFVLFRFASSPDSADNNSFIRQVGQQAKKFISFAGSNFALPERQTEKQQAEKISTEKAAALQAKLEAMEKFSRVTFFYTAPYLASIAIPEAWEKKYRTAEENNSIDFYYAPTAAEDYPLFQISILSRDEWEKKQGENNNFQVIKMVSNFVFFYQIYDTRIDNPVKAEDFDEMKNQVKSVINSFKTYKQ
jgi:hypothetical protein